MSSNEEVPGDYIDALKYISQIQNTNCKLNEQLHECWRIIRLYSDLYEAVRMCTKDGLQCSNAHAVQWLTETMNEIRMENEKQNEGAPHDQN